MGVDLRAENEHPSAFYLNPPLYSIKARYLFGPDINFLKLFSPWFDAYSLKLEHAYSTVDAVY